MSTSEAETQVVVASKKVKKLKPARKQVKPGEVEKKEAPQTGKEYSVYLSLHCPHCTLVHARYRYLVQQMGGW